MAVGLHWHETSGEKEWGQVFVEEKAKRGESWFYPAKSKMLQIEAEKVAFLRLCPTMAKRSRLERRRRRSCFFYFSGEWRRWQTTGNSAKMASGHLCESVCMARHQEPWVLISNPTYLHQTGQNPIRFAFFFLFLHVHIYNYLLFWRHDVVCKSHWG